MPLLEPCPVPTCRARPGRERHCHPLLQLNAIGEVCWTCKVADWQLWFGGALPVMVRCARCAAGFNLSERLRLTTQPKGKVTA